VLKFCNRSCTRIANLECCRAHSGSPTAPSTVSR